MRKLVLPFCLALVIASCKSEKKTQNVVSEAEYQALADRLAELEKKHGELTTQAELAKKEYAHLQNKTRQMTEKATRVLESLQLLQRNNFYLNRKYNDMQEKGVAFLQGTAELVELRVPEDTFYEGLSLQQKRLMELLTEGEELAFRVYGEHSPEFDTLAKEFAAIEKQMPEWKQSFRPLWLEQSSATLKFLQHVFRLNDVNVDSLDWGELRVEYESSLGRLKQAAAQQAVDDYKAQQQGGAEQEVPEEDPLPQEQEGIDDKEKLSAAEGDKLANKKEMGVVPEMPMPSEGEKPAEGPEKEIPPLNPKKSGT